MKKYRTMKIVCWGLAILIVAAWGFWAGFHGQMKTSPMDWLCVALAVVLTEVPVVAEMTFVNRELRKIAPLDRADPAEYIHQLKALLGGEKGIFKQLYYVNLGSALCNLGEYAAAKRTIALVKKKWVPLLFGRQGANVFWANLALVHFSLGEDAEGLAILTAHRKLPEKLEAIKTVEDVRQLVAMLRIYRLLAEGNREGARQLLEASRSLWDNAARDKTLETLEKRLGR